jgi:uncharacterized membrane protein
MRHLVRDFRQRPWAQKAYLAAKLVAGPLGVVLVAVGAMGHDHIVLVAGIVLLGIFAIDMLLIAPIFLARQDLKRRQHSSDPN